jgi:hypothetical protein
VTRPQLEPFAGDTGLFPVMRQLAERVDVALLSGGWLGSPAGGAATWIRGGRPRRSPESSPAIAMPIHWGCWDGMAGPASGRAEGLTP